MSFLFPLNMPHQREAALLLVMACFCGGVAAQSGPASGGIKLFFEKVYLHTDREEYAPGENIWFKAYLVNAQSNYPTNTSKNLYVELIAPNHTVVSREVLRLEEGIAAGDFRLEDGMVAGTYRLGAYTNWMRNFGSRFIFEKAIYISPVPAGNSAAGAADFSQATVAAAAGTTAGSIQFLPEGGTLVAGLHSTVAFKAVDKNGKGIAASGCLLTAGGDTAATFTTSWAGMGVFAFTPQAGIQYSAQVQYGTGMFYGAPFPEIFADGFVMHVTGADTGKLTVSIQTNPVTASAFPSGEMTLAGRHGGRIIYKEKIYLKNRIAVVAIDRNIFPEGIASFTLYDERLHPHCERLVYVKNSDPLEITIATDKATYAPKGKTTVHLSIAGAQQQPQKAVLSMAVVDAGMVHEPESNIAAYLLLQSELSGKIENPARYFSSTNSHRFEQLELLMQTQGWRSFLWRQVADTTLHISYLPEPGITVSGSVKSNFAGKPLAGMNITLYAGGAMGNKLFVAKTDTSGKYYVDGLCFYGLQTIKLNAKNAKGKKGGAIVVDSLFGNAVAVSDTRSNTPANPPDLRLFAAEAYRRTAVIKNDTSRYSVLPGVTVKKKKEVVVLRDGTAYVEFGYPEYNFTISSVDYTYGTLENFLIHNIPGAVADVEHEGITIIANGQVLRPRFVVDKKEDVFERLDYYAVPINQVRSVSVRHLVGTPTYNVDINDLRTTIGAGLRDVFVIYLSLKEGAYNQDPSALSTEVTGYYASRIFYAPVYPLQEDSAAADVRTTIYWQPYIVTDNNGKAMVQFYNADPKTSVRIYVEGLTEKGTTVYGTATYLVK